MLILVLISRMEERQMKKALALLIIPAITLTGCAKYDKPGDYDYYCQKIIHKMHSLPSSRYDASGSNKRVATEHAKLQKEYQQYNCAAYQEHRGSDERYLEQQFKTLN